MHLCGTCGKTFPTERKLNLHLLNHKEDPTSCPECLKVFQNDLKLNIIKGRVIRRRKCVKNVLLREIPLQWQNTRGLLTVKNGTFVFIAKRTFPDKIPSLNIPKNVLQQKRGNPQRKSVHSVMKPFVEKID